MEPFFLEGCAGRLFAIYRAPAPGAAQRGDVLFLPPFAEEMNRSRRMTTLMAERLAQIGHGSLVFDLYGTGDSEGEFADATLEIWRDDVRRALDWLAAREASSLALLGLRFGAALALEAASSHPPRLARLVLWQPIASGEQMMTQFLRIRIAADMERAAPATTTVTLRGRLAAGETLEVAGYSITGPLAAGIDAVRLNAPGEAAGVPVHWFELVAEAGQSAPPAAARVVEAWGSAGCAVTLRTVPGVPFWTLQETTVAPNLLDATAECFT